MDKRSSPKRLARRDLAVLLSEYGLTLDAYKSLRRRRGAQRIYILTSKGSKFLLKQYKDFSYSVKKSLFLLDFLAKKGYPSTRIILSKKGMPFVNYKNSNFALFEFLHFPKGMPTVSKKRAYEVGKYLAILHTTTKEFPLYRSNRGYAHYRKMFIENYYKIRKAPEKNRLIMRYIKENIDRLKAPDNLPKGICHVEFVQKHLLFKGSHLYRVIDWDFISRDTLFYDIGTASIVSFHFTKSGVLRFDFVAFASFVKGYDKYRKLSKWEREHMYEAALYGAFKYAIWDIPGEAWGLRTFDLVGELMRYDKKSFEERISKAYKQA